MTTFLLKTQPTTLSLKTEDDFGRRMRGLARGLWNADIDFMTWADSTVMAIYRGYEQAWQEGERRVGITPDERSPEEVYKLHSLINDDITRVMGLGDFIEAHTKALGYKYASVVSRVELWVNRYASVANIAAVTAGADKKMVWHLGATEVHCTDCLSYEGRVYRASVWEKYGALPQSRSLECGGWRCDCRLVPTESSASKGRPRSPIGGG